jgi:hypothetical protein
MRALRAAPSPSRHSRLPCVRCSRHDCSLPHRLRTLRGASARYTRERGVHRRAQTYTDVHARFRLLTVLSFVLALLTPAPSLSVAVCACVACAARPACASLSRAASNPASSRPRASSRVAATCGACVFKSHICIYIRRRVAPRLHVQRLRACLRFASPLLGWDVRRATPDAQRPCAYAPRIHLNGLRTRARVSLRCAVPP